MLGVPAATCKYTVHQCSTIDFYGPKHTYDFSAETHLAAGVMSASVSRRPPLLECPTLTIIGSTALRKGPQRF